MAAMQMPGGDWHPVIPSHLLRKSDNIVAGFSKRQELALWRSREGVVQVWENRCPHRGTRLTLGRIIGDRLSCAYHGWEFSADGGKCAAIPAHPNTPAPRQLCVKTYAAAEANGMVWVSHGGSAEAASTSPMELLGKPSTTARAFVRTLGLRANLDVVADELAAQGLAAQSPWAWAGALEGWDVTVFLTEASDALTFAHLWVSEDSGESRTRTFTAANRLRSAIESRMTAGS